MARPKTPQQIEELRSSNKPFYHTWAEGDKDSHAKAVADAGQAINRADTVVRRTSASTLYKDVAPGNQSVRDEFDRRDWDKFRPGDRLPRTDKEIIKACLEAYEQVGIVHNTVDMMAEFVVQGIDVVHPNPRIEKFHKSWARKVGMAYVSERIANLIYSGGQAPVKRQTAKLKAKNVDDIYHGIAEADLDVEDPPPVAKREIPWAYTLYNPLQVEVLGDELALFVGKSAVKYGLKVSEEIARRIQYATRDNDKALVELLPEGILSTISAGERILPLDPDKFTVLHYKKHDWQVWARPMLHSILKDLSMYQKFKLADLAALDGVISNIRLWRLGDLKERILPSETAINRLAEVLMNNTGGGTLDLIWGPELDFKESSTDAHRWLGEAKYAPTLQAIYAGLGIPPTLTGAATASGFTNNYISLKTLVERLEYVRRLLRDFWADELRIIQRAMGFRFPAEVVFDRNSLTDEATRLQLLLHMADRGLISTETLQERFGETPEIEQVRIRRENRMRADGKMTPVAGPFHDPQTKEAYTKLFVQQGVVTPSEVGVELKPVKPGEKIPLVHKKEQTPAKPGPEGKKKGQPGQGRPPGKKDKEKRKQKTVRPRTSAGLFAALDWVEASQKTVAEVVHPAYLAKANKKNLRQLTEAEFADLEKFKFALLCNLTPFEPVTAKVIAEVASKPLPVPFSFDFSADEPIEHLRKTQARALATHILKSGVSPEGGPSNGEI